MMAGIRENRTLSFAFIALTFLFAAAVIAVSVTTGAFRRATLANTAAILISASSAVSLLFFSKILRDVRLAFDEPGRTASSSSEEDWRLPAAVAGFLGLLWFSISLPPIFRSIANSREMIPSWLDDAMTVDQITYFLKGVYSVPTYRFTQGWLLFLPTALYAKFINGFVPVNQSMIAVLMNLYQLAVVFFVVASAFILIFRISRSYWLALSVVLIAFSRWDFFFAALPCVRMDNIQLLFMLLSFNLMYSFYVKGTSGTWFLAVFFAAMAFSAKYAGHLLTPLLAATWFVNWGKHQEESSLFAHNLKGLFWLAASVVVIFPLTFSVFNPYHWVFFPSFADIFTGHLTLYKSGNFWGLPDYVQQSPVRLWWNVFTKSYPHDLYLTVLFLTGAIIALARLILDRAHRQTPEGFMEALLLLWALFYIPFLVTMYAGMAQYLYVLPIVFIIPFFALLPLLWVLRMVKAATVQTPYIHWGLCAAAFTGVYFFSKPNIDYTRSFLATFRAQNTPQFEVGRFLDRRVPLDENPVVLNTLFAYVPPRFTAHEYQHNTDLTDALIRRIGPDYIIIHTQFYDSFADKSTEGLEDYVNNINKVHFKYVDVVRCYTTFKHRTRRDFNYIKTIGPFEIFERNKERSKESRLVKVRWDWTDVSRWVTQGPSIQVNKAGNGLSLMTNGDGITYQIAFELKPLTKDSDYEVRGMIRFRGQSSIRVGILTKDRGSFLAVKDVSGNGGVRFSVPFHNGDDGVFVLFNNNNQPAQAVEIAGLELYELHEKEAAPARLRS